MGPSPSSKNRGGPSISNPTSSIPAAYRHQDDSRYRPRATAFRSRCTMSAVLLLNLAHRNNWLPRSFKMAPHRMCSLARLRFQMGQPPTLVIKNGRMKFAVLLPRGLGVGTWNRISWRAKQGGRKKPW